MTQWQHKYFGIRRPWHVHGSEGARQTSYVKIQLCDPCQKWLANKFETPGELLLTPIMRADRVAITPADQSFMAAYITKQALLLDLHLHREPYMDFPTQARRLFRRTGTALGSTQVWISCVNQTDVDPEEPVLFPIPGAVPQPEDPEPQVLGPGGVNWVFALDWLQGVFVNAPEDIGPDGVGHGAAFVALERAEQAGLITRIWPIQLRGIDWPMPLIEH